LGALARGGAAPHHPGGSLGQLSRPQAVRARPAGPCCAGCPVGLVGRLASQPGPCTGCTAAVHTRPGLLAYAPEEFSACGPGSARPSITGGSGPEPTRSVRSTSAVQRSGCPAARRWSPRLWLRRPSCQGKGAGGPAETLVATPGVLPHRHLSASRLACAVGKAQWLLQPCRPAGTHTRLGWPRTRGHHRSSGCPAAVPGPATAGPAPPHPDGSAPLAGQAETNGAFASANSTLTGELTPNSRTGTRNPPHSAHLLSASLPAQPVVAGPAVGGDRCATPPAQRRAPVRPR